MENFSAWPALSFFKDGMKTLSQIVSACSFPRRSAAIFGFLAAISTAHAVPAEDGATGERNLTRNAGARIECTTPDGRILEMAATNDQQAGAGVLVLDNDTVSCPLAEGQTTFVIKLPTAALLDRFTFVNENAAAAGELKISVSDERLSPDSPRWVDVDGSTGFTKKRLISLLMVGVEARYVKLTFNVDKPGRIASLGLYGGEKLERLARR